MIKRQNRLSTNFEFNITRKYGIYYKSDLFHIYILKPKNYTGPARFGIVISNKFDKSAVRRNKVKRFFRRAILENIEKFPENTWVVIHPKHSCSQKPYEEISSEFAKTLQKVSFTN